MRITALFLLATTAVLTSACGGDSSMGDAGDAGRHDAGPADTGVPISCPDSDGTILSDCMHFDCVLRQASAMYCPGTTRFTFNCTGVEALPAGYQATLHDYFTNCPGVWPTLMEEDVPVMGGTVHVTVCQQVNCTHLFDNDRGPAPGVFNAECFPIADDAACDLPNPP
jgi:hypothetical protein